MSLFQCRAPLAFAVMGAYHDRWPCAEHQEGLSYSSGADKTFSVVTREIVWSQAARSPPVQKGHAGCWKSRTKQKTIDLLKKQQTFNWWQDPWFVFWNWNQNVHYTTWAWLRSTWQSWFLSLDKSMMSSPAKWLFGLPFQCVRVAMPGSARVLLLYCCCCRQPPRRQWWGASWPPAAGKGLRHRRPYKLQVLVKWCDGAHRLESPKPSGQKGRSVLTR